MPRSARNLLRIWRTPGRLRRRRHEKRNARGRHAITHGLDLADRLALDPATVAALDATHARMTADHLARHA